MSTAPDRARIHTLVVDAERVARRRLARRLSQDLELVVRECGSGEEALEMIRTSPVDLVFLDVRMRGMGGFEVIAALDPSTGPLVIFTTAFAEHALRAFEVRALDYLLKPVSDERLADALGRAKEFIQLRRLAATRDHIAAMLTSARTPFRFLIRSGRSRYFVDASTIDWVASADNYSRLWTGGRSHLVRESMRSVEESLAPHGFLRVHRTAIVSLARVSEVRATATGGYTIMLHDGQRLPLSRDRRRDLLDALRSARRAGR